MLYLYRSNFLQVYGGNFYKMELIFPLWGWALFVSIFVIGSIAAIVFLKNKAAVAIPVFFVMLIFNAIAMPFVYRWVGGWKLLEGVEGEEFVWFFTCIFGVFQFAFEAFVYAICWFIYAKFTNEKFTSKFVWGLIGLIISIVLGYVLLSSTGFSFKKIIGGIIC